MDMPVFSHQSLKPGVDGPFTGFKSNQNWFEQTWTDPEAHIPAKEFHAHPDLQLNDIPDAEPRREYITLTDKDIEGEASAKSDQAQGQSP